MFNTHYKRERQAPEKGTGQVLVDRVGYVPAQKRIEDLMYAGQKLRDFRAQQFDYQDVKDDDGFTIDPTRSSSYDIADAFQDTQKLVIKASQTKPEDKPTTAQEKAVEAPKTTSKDVTE